MSATVATRRKALIVGSCSQDGYHLVRLLLKKNYKVWGTVKSKQQHSEDEMDGLHHNFTSLQLDLTNDDSVLAVLDKMKTVLFDGLAADATGNCDCGTASVDCGVTGRLPCNGTRAA